MLFLKSVLNGVGSGAGVAWPLFGIGFAIIGGSIGGFFSLTLGIFSLFLFLAIGSTIFYYSLKQTQDNEQIIQEQLQTNQQKLLTDINEYIESVRRYFSYEQNGECFNDVFKRILDTDLDKIRSKDVHSPLSQILLLLKDEFEAKQTIPNTTIILKRIVHTASQQPVPLSEKFISAFFTFVGTFGSIAGCSAGLSGVLTGMGIFSSFAAFPLLGWGVLTFALCSGLTFAHQAFIKAGEDYNIKLLNQKLKCMHQQLSKATMVRNLNASLFYVFKGLGIQNEQKNGAALPEQQPFMDLYLRQLYKGQPKLSFLPFLTRTHENVIQIQDKASTCHSAV
ncbi:hypothetical protein [Fluoribacter gormanii]|uniref:hypothetical protein n=1 Tax=Fluoribacter gormanii TaxID=464 RepID=UPI00104161C1|nr:hypothetical protein [Fluoribacter gormanii]